jgi:hypothetical protein
MEVLVDFTTLQPGVDWPPQLHEMMACCHAAVLLLTRNALNSAWVLKEATILAWRAALDKQRFKLFVVQMQDVAENDLSAAKFDPLMLKTMQLVVAEKPADIARIVIEHIPRTPEFQAPFDSGIPLDSMIFNLSALLKQVDPDILGLIRAKLALSAPNWQPSQYGQYPDAALIARRLVRGEIGTYQRVEELVEDLARSTPAQTVNRIFQEIAPYWVPAQDAGRLPSLRTEAGKLWAVMIGTLVSNYSAEMHVRRAHAGSLLAAAISIPRNNGGDLEDHISTEVCAWYRREFNVDLDNEGVTALINIERKFWYVVVSLPVLPPDDVIKSLMDTFQTLRFIFDLKKKPDAEDTEEDHNWACLEIDQTDEIRQWSSRSNVILILKNLKAI